MEANLGYIEASIGETNTAWAAIALGLEEKREQEGSIGEDLSVSKSGNLVDLTKMDEASQANHKHISIWKMI